MNKIRISRRYNGMFKLSVVKLTADSVWEECDCHTGNNLLFRTDYSARLVGKLLLLDANLSIKTHTIYISSTPVIHCSEDTALLIISSWLEQGLFLGSVSVNKPNKTDSPPYMECVYRGAS